MKEWPLRVLLILLPLSLAELGARALYSPNPELAGGEWHFEFDSRRNYRWKANHSGVFGTEKFQTNADHRVGRPLPQARTPGLLRLAVVGDSVSFGFNVPYASSFVPQLEKKLPAEALNFAVPGYSTFQEWADIEESAPWCPDLVLLQFSFNDLVEPFLFLRRLGGIGVDYHRVPDASSLHFLLRSHSRFYSFVADQLTRSVISVYGKEEMQAHLQREAEYEEKGLLENPTAEKSRNVLDEFQFWLKKAGEACRNGGSPCVFLVGPASFRWFYASPAIEAGVSRIRTLAEKEGFQVIDPWPELRTRLESGAQRSPVAKWNELFLDQIHPTAAGHAWLADFLAPRLRAILLRHPARVCGGN